MNGASAKNMTRRPTTEIGDLLHESAKFVSRSNSSEVMSPPIAEILSNSEEVTDGGGRRRSPDPNAPIYGELIVLGTNGSLPCPAISSKMSNSFILRKQHKATGVSVITRDPRDMDSLSRKSTHTVTINKSSSASSVTEYGHDPNTDLFQIGRSADSAIAFVVVETVSGPDGKRNYKSNSTVSRYACRIQCERKPPYSARLYAAAFDTRGRIQLSANAPMWQTVSGEHDGLTTNGVAFMRPVGIFESGVAPSEWREVSVMGNVLKLREQRSSRNPGASVPEETNILTDGCLVDLCGITLMWRTAIGLAQGPSQTILREHRRALNEKSPQCPVNLLTLHFRSGSGVSAVSAETVTDLDQAVAASSREPWVYLSCGHVYSQHDWKAGPEESNKQRTCPLCRKVGPYVKLDLGRETGFFIDDGPLSHAFVPCGHVTTEKTTKYWVNVRIPHLASEWSSRCPFCTAALDKNTPTVKLLFS